MNRYLSALFASGLALAWGSAARAEDVSFGYSYGAETPEAGEAEIELRATDRRGKDQGHYDAQDYRLEIERGITDRFAAAVYVNFESQHIRGLEPDFTGVDRDFGFSGLSTEFKYNVIKPGKRRVGLTFYAEPGWSRIRSLEGNKATEYELELKAIVQKNLLDDRLVWVGNLTVEPEWEQESERDLSGAIATSWHKELKTEATTGLAYRIGSRWSVGLEGRYRGIYPDWTHGLHRAAYAMSAGPMVHFSAGKFDLTATYLPQLVGGPARAGSNLNLAEHEKQELRIKLGFDL